jgi:hypothetical protein
VRLREPTTIWRDAHDRVTAYLRASRVHDPELCERLGDQIVAAARQRYETESNRTPGDLVAEETRRLVEAWTTRYLGPATDESIAQRFAHARAAVLLANLTERWPDGFLNPAEQPPEFGRRFKSTYLQSGPDLEFSNMSPRPIDLGPMSGLADRTWKTFDKWPMLRGLATWSAFAAALVLAFLALRY